MDSILFGSILKTYISEHGVTWTNLGNVCIFDGLENVTEHCVRWYDDHVKQASIDSARRETEKHSTRTLLDTVTTFGEVNHANVPRPLLPLGVKIFEAEPLIDRKSSFVGRACAITDPSQVQGILRVPLLGLNSMSLPGAGHPGLSYIGQEDIPRGTSYHSRLESDSRGNTISR